MTQRIIAILAHQRSGTHFLGTSIASHPDIKYTGEIFRQNVPTSREEVWGKIKRVSGGEFPVICLDTKYNQVSRSLEDFLARPEIKVIHLIRRNVLRLYFSGELQAWRGKHPGDDSVPVFQFDESRFHCLRDSIRGQMRRLGYLTDLKLYYEDLTGDRDVAGLPEHATRQICLLAGVAYQPLMTPIRKEAPVNVAGHLVGVPDRLLRRYQWPTE